MAHPAFDGPHRRKRVRRCARRVPRAGRLRYARRPLGRAVPSRPDGRSQGERRGRVAGRQCPARRAAQIPGSDPRHPLAVDRPKGGGRRHPARRRPRARGARPRRRPCGRAHPPGPGSTRRGRGAVDRDRALQRPRVGRGAGGPDRPAADQYRRGAGQPDLAGRGLCRRTTRSADGDRGGPRHGLGHRAYGQPGARADEAGCPARSRGAGLARPAVDHRTRPRETR